MHRISSSSMPTQPSQMPRDPDEFLKSQLSHIEYTLALDTRNRDLATYPDANDFVLDVNLPQKSLPIVRMYLGSIELPLTQLTIEEEWSRLYFDEGISVRAPMPAMNVIAAPPLPANWTNPPPAEDLNSLGITIYDPADGGNTFTAYVPPWLNPVYIDDYAAIPGPVTFHTYYPHGLHLRSFWNYGAPMQLISTAGATSYPLDGTTDSNITIIDEYTFSILSSGSASPILPLPVPPSSGAHIYGYLHAPAVANPRVFSELVTAAMNDELENGGAVPAAFNVKFVYSTDENRFAVMAYYTTAASSSPLEFGVPYEPVLYASGSAASVGQLPKLMGFPCTPIPFKTVHPSASSAVTPSTAIYSTSPFMCMSSIRITPGFYGGAGLSNLLADAQQQFNRLTFENNCEGSGNPAAIVLSDRCGVCHEIRIPFGSYQPHTFAAALTSAINDAGSGMPNNGSNDAYLVEFVVDEAVTVHISNAGLIAGNFVISSTEADGGYSFGIEAADAADTLSGRIGFDPICHRSMGTSMYMGKLLYFPIKGPCPYTLNCNSGGYEDLSTILFTENSYLPFVNSTTKQIGFQVCSRKANNGYTADALTASSGYAEMTLYDANYAHGFQVDDVVDITISALTPATRRVRVVDVIDAYRFTVDVSGFLPDIIAASSVAFPPFTDVCASLYADSIMNLYFAHNMEAGNCAAGSAAAAALNNGKYPNSIHAEMLGFASNAVLWQTPWASLPIIAPGQYSLEHPDYLLIEFLEPSESTYIQHRWKNDLKTRIFGKLVIYPSIRLERNYPIESIFQGNKLVSKLHVRILNPNHTLYKFHGREWSMTLVLVAQMGLVKAMCY